MMDIKNVDEPPTKRQKSSKLNVNINSATNNSEFKVPAAKVPRRKTAKRSISKLKENRIDLEENKCSIVKQPTEVKNKELLEKDSSYLIKYQPKNKNDLCIDKKKLSALEDWFNSIYVDKKVNIGRVLVLYGPTGCGKTSSVFCLARHFDVKIFEFEEKTQTGGLSFEELKHTQHVGKQLDQIQNFVTSANSAISKKDRERRKAILLKDLPSTFVSKVDDFHEFLRNYQFIFRKGAPIIIILTMDDKMNATIFKKLFPLELSLELDIHSIEINGVGKKQMRSVLERINLSGLVSKRDIDILIDSSNGDVRSAINALEFMIEADKNDSFEILSNKSSNVMAIKDTSPTFFHMLGKILYCKREGDEVASKKRSSSQELKNHSFDFDDSFELIDQSLKRRRLKESPEELVDHIDSNGETLSLFIHESYLDFVDHDFNNAANIIMNLSLIDSHFSSLWTKIDNWEYSEFDDYMKLLAIRGTMFNLNTKAQQAKTKKQFKAFSKPRYYSIAKDEDIFRCKIEERSKMDSSQFRTKDEMMEIMYYKERNLFAKLCRS